MERRYRRTIIASYLGYGTQAIVNNLAPLLFVIFQEEFHISVSQIGFLVTFNFLIQILTDYVSAKFVDRVGYKKCIIAAHIFSAVGLVGLGIFPDLFHSPYAGLLVAIAIYAVGGGLIEVLVTPIVEAVPANVGGSSIPLLHASYPWTHAIMVIATTVYLRFAGSENWRFLPYFWALIPTFNIFLYAVSPVHMLSEKTESISVKKLFSMKLFWLLVILMICSGASEQAMIQWASYFAEKGLHVSKSVGDLIGPCMFAILMGIVRVTYGIKGDKIPIQKTLTVCGILCIISYLTAVFAPHPIISLIGCGICGISVALMWPGVFTLAAKACPEGGTAMFAYLALAGDVGCSAGPSVVGTVSEAFGGQLKIGILAAILFPLGLTIGIRALKSGKK